MFKQAEYSTDTSEKVKCFICDNLLTVTAEWKNLLQSRTKYSNTDFCTMIGQLIGTSFLVYITTGDYVCATCEKYINKVDKFSGEINKCKEILSEFARKKYDESKNYSKTYVEDTFSSEIVLLKNDFNCILCDHRTYTLELLQKHIQSHDYKTNNGTSDTSQTPDIEYRCGKCTSKFYNAHDMNSHFSECVNTPKILNDISITPIKKTKSAKLEMSSNGTTENESSTGKDNFPKSLLSNPKRTLRTVRLNQRRKSNLNTENHKMIVPADLVESQLIEYAPESYNPAPVQTAFHPRYIRNELYVCHICKYKTYSQESMRNHIRIHRQDYVECLICKKLFKNAKTLRRHLSSHTSVTCDVCNKEFPNAAVYNAHVMLHHPKQVFESDLKTNTAELTFGSDMLIEEYIDTEDNSNASRQFCIVCSTLVTGDDHTCNSSVSAAIYEPDHTRTHTEHVKKNHDNSVGGDPFCQYCGKEITPPQKLKEHERRHVKFERLNLQCPNCPKNFRTQTGLDYHMAKHTGNYKIYCEICNKGFMSQKFLEEHKGVHTKEDRYVCDVCGRKFCYKSTYRMHRLWHDNPMPYECNICGEKFSHSSVRKLHIRRVHTGERPYTCQYCNKSFLRATILTNHIMQHTQEFSFKCEPCNKGFTTRQKYAVHLAKIHKDPSLLTKTECQYKMALKPSEKNIKEEQEQSKDAIFLDPNNIYTIVNHENVESENLQHVTTQNYFEGFKYEIITDDALQEYVVMAEEQSNSIIVENQNIIVET